MHLCTLHSHHEVTRRLRNDEALELFSSLLPRFAGLCNLYGLPIHLWLQFGEDRPRTPLTRAMDKEPLKRVRSTTNVLHTQSELARSK